MPEISFFSEDIEFRFEEEEKAFTWLTQVASNHNKKPGTLNIIFCSDPYLHKLNVHYLQHDTLTDIITFPYEDDGGNISGDVFISIDRIRENALIFRVEENMELIRVMAHGLLHLCGFKDKTTAEKQAMQIQEDKAIELWKNL